MQSSWKNESVVDVDHNDDNYDKDFDDIEVVTWTGTGQTQSSWKNGPFIDVDDDDTIMTKMLMMMTMQQGRAKRRAAEGMDPWLHRKFLLPSLPSGRARHYIGIKLISSHLSTHWSHQLISGWARHNLGIKFIWSHLSTHWSNELISC